MTHPKKLALSMVTRRKVLGACAAVSVMGMASGEGRSSAGEQKLPSRGPRTDTRLYAFRSPENGRLVLAVTAASSWADRIPAEPRIQTRFYLGTCVLTVPAADIRREAGFRSFSGPVAVHVGGQPRALQTALLEVPIEGLELQNIWAERVGADGHRQRVPSPFLAALIAENPSLAQVYDAGTPATDSTALAERVASTIALLAERSQFSGDCRAYGQRIARTLLPDVLRYDPKLPFGFTFAARNGHHPDDAVFAVVHSVLTGTPVTGYRQRVLANLRTTFPYFQPAGA